MAQKFLELAFTEEVRQAQEQFYGRTHRLEGERPPDRLTPAEGAFIRARDSFYMASVSSTGWPYLQHRGGAPGFIRMVDDHTLAFVDLGGNRQLISTGNLAGNDRVALFFMDYRRQARLKVLGRARMAPVQDHGELVAHLLSSEETRRAERVCLIEVVGYDWNCPQHITPRLTFKEAEATMAPLQARIAELEAQRQALQVAVTERDEALARCGEAMAEVERLQGLVTQHQKMGDSMTAVQASLGAFATKMREEKDRAEAMEAAGAKVIDCLERMARAGEG